MRRRRSYKGGGGARRREEEEVRRSRDCSWVPVQGLQPADDLEKKKLGGSELIGQLTCEASLVGGACSVRHAPSW